MHEHWSRLEHHLSVPNLKATFLDSIQAKNKYFTLSSNLGIGVTTLLKILLLRSFHKIHTHKSQISWRNDRFALPPPVRCTNWRKWSAIILVSTPIMPNQWHTRGHNEEKILQDKNKWCDVSTNPQFETHKETYEEITRRWTKLDLVGNLSRSNLQAKIETFNGTWLCQIKDVAGSARGLSFVVSNW